ncbi:MAG: CBU_0585 family protein [Candidatus Aquirickettsiella sp.]
MKTIKNKLNPDRNFVSDIDRFLAAFDKRHPKKSASQEQEIEQYQALMAKRDIKTDTHS